MSKIRFKVTTTADGKEFWRLQLKQGFLCGWENLRITGQSGDEARNRCDYHFGTREFAEVWRDVWIKQEAARKARRDAERVVSTRTVAIKYP